jgi:hypothetical protein
MTADQIAHATDSQLVITSVLVSTGVVIGARLLGPRVIPVIARVFPVARQLIQGGARVLPRTSFPTPPIIFPGATPLGATP